MAYPGADPRSRNRVQGSAPAESAQGTEPVGSAGRVNAAELAGDLEKARTFYMKCISLCQLTENRVFKIIVQNNILPKQPNEKRDGMFLFDLQSLSF
jgi:hypothetical protein